MKNRIRGRTLVLSTSLMTALLLAVTVALADSGTVPVQRSTVEPTAIAMRPYPAVPSGVDETDCVGCPSTRHAKRWVEIPVEPGFDPATLGPIGPPTPPPIDPRAAAGRAKAPGDFVFYHSYDFTPAFMHPLRYGYVMEPSFAVDGRGIFWSGNVYAAYSGDYGQSFTRINPRDNFPVDNHTDLVMGGSMCCDQDVVYDARRGAWIWLVQYYVEECKATNVQRLAVAPTTEAMLDNQWHVYDLSPLNFGHALTDSMWLDFPHLTVGDNYLYHVSKMEEFQVDSTCYDAAPDIAPPEVADDDKQLGSTNHVVARYPLDEMVQGLPISVEWWTTNLTHGMRACAGATGPTMYFGSHLTTGTLRVFIWPEIAFNASFDDVAHNGFDPSRPFEATGPDGENWAGRMDHYIQGAWAANGVLGFMFAATTGGGYTYPAVHVIRVAESDRSLLSHEMVWNPDFGFAFPNCHPNDRGHVAGVMAFGGGDLHPNTMAWIADDYNGGTFQPLEHYQFTFADSGPDGVRWGDYFTARKNVPYGNTWGGSGQCLIGGQTDDYAHGYYVWFGRERDTPPPHHTIHVNWANFSGWEDGSAAHPYNTVTEGHFAAVDGDTVIVQAGTYPEAVVLSTEVHVKSAGGMAIIGP